MVRDMLMKQEQNLRQARNNGSFMGFDCRRLEGGIHSLKCLILRWRVQAFSLRIGNGGNVSS